MFIENPELEFGIILMLDQLQGTIKILLIGSIPVDYKFYSNLENHNINQINAYLAFLHVECRFYYFDLVMSLRILGSVQGATFRTELSKRIHFLVVRKQKGFILRNDSVDVR